MASCVRTTLALARIWASSREQCVWWGGGGSPDPHLSRAPVFLSFSLPCPALPCDAVVDARSLALLSLSRASDARPRTERPARVRRVSFADPRRWAALIPPLLYLSEPADISSSCSGRRPSIQSSRAAAAPRGPCFVACPSSPHRAAAGAALASSRRRWRRVQHADVGRAVAPPLPSAGLLIERGRGGWEGEGRGECRKVRA